MENFMGFLMGFWTENFIGKVFCIKWISDAFFKEILVLEIPNFEK